MAELKFKVGDKVRLANAFEIVAVDPEDDTWTYMVAVRDAIDYSEQVWFPEADLISAKPGEEVKPQ